ncbi:MAG: peptide deformylase [Phycisphaerae bacterium]|jgi:peptide deformylase
MLVDELPRSLVIYPDPRLRQKCAPIRPEEFDASLPGLARRMLEIMHAQRGVGLAGPQVGIARRIFVCNPTGEPADDRVYVNPVLSELTGAVEGEEGCLSIPEVRVMVRRARSCRVAGFDVTGRPIEERAEELLARIWQHETDHLDGRLIIDRMTPADRIATKKQLAQLEAAFRKRR